MTNTERKIRDIFRFEIGYDKEGASPLFFRIDKKGVENIIVVLIRELGENDTNTT